eukprot:CAMPEP_0117598750 /NCGR_PEP_ID=MMETSP0784-20121206/75571_1 /TAXON_ID=39447 /ORGANISM="" /LENGTH=34 /DNA_ID= /DNA_START= /DNA_END= /DNA_ORIENTATION=
MAITWPDLMLKQPEHTARFDAEANAAQDTAGGKV